MQLPRIFRLAGCFSLALHAARVSADQAAPALLDGAYHVHPGQSIQAALDAAAADPSNKVVRVHAGTYRPERKGQALIWFNHAHEGIQLESLGTVILTAANPKIADRSSESFPAVVNHIVYFGDGISRKTVLRGFKLTGANNFVTDQPGPEAIEPHFEDLRATEGFYGALFFYTDGGAIKIFGRSYPVIADCEIYGNYSAPCAGGISIEHRGFKEGAVLLTNCVFRGNRALVTGSAVDLLPGSFAEIQNCLFIGNISNTGKEYKILKGNIDWPEIPKLTATTLFYQPKHGSGALTVFPGSAVHMNRCTFTGNFNGVDDRGGSSVYRNSIFWMNNAAGGKRPGKRFEMDVAKGSRIINCFVNGIINDLQGTIDPRKNTLNCPDPNFDENWTPQNKTFHHAGARLNRSANAKDKIEPTKKAAQ